MARREGCEDYEPSHDLKVPMAGDNFVYTGSLKGLLEALRKGIEQAKKKSQPENSPLISG